MNQKKTPISPLSSLQRRCHLLLLLYTAQPKLQLTSICEINQVTPDIAQQDIAYLCDEINQFYHLSLIGDNETGYQILGSVLNKRLCLIQWLKRALRCSPKFVTQSFAPLVWQPLAAHPYLYIQIQNAITTCELHFKNRFNENCELFLQHYLSYCLLQSHHHHHPSFNDKQSAWLRQKPEQAAAQAIMQILAPYFPQHEQQNELDFLTLLFTLMKNHNYKNSAPHEDKRLKNAITNAVQHFEHFSTMSFSSKEQLFNQLFAHIDQALERCYFNIGIGNLPIEEIVQTYPCLIRTTQKALKTMEQEFDIIFPDDEVSLIAIIFGAWLLQDCALPEKHIVLLTNDNPQLEKELEHQIRELTLLPLNIKHLSVYDFLHTEKLQEQEIALIVTPYELDQKYPLPFPLVHTQLPLPCKQQKVIRDLLEEPEIIQ